MGLSDLPKLCNVKKALAGECSALGGSTCGSSNRQRRSENVGLSNTNIGENRVPPQGLSTEGESRPKIRPKGIVDGFP
jgi:hypothetical protein